MTDVIAHPVKGGVSSAPPITLRNDVIEVGIDPGTGGIVKLTDLRNGQEHMHAPTGRIFRITGPRNGMGSAAIDSEFQSGEVAESSERRLVLRFTELNAHDYDATPLTIPAEVEVQYWLEDGPELFTGITITNRSENAFEQVHFPLISGWTGYAGKGVDLLTTGSIANHGTVDPHADNISREVDWYTLLGAFEKWELPFPVRGATPWLDLSGGGVGLGIHNYMTVPRAGGAMLRDHSLFDKKHIMEVGWYSIVDIQPGASWTSPRFGIHLHQGDWHDTADHYGQWLRTWWKPKIADEAFKRTLGFQNVIVRDFDGLKYRRFSDLPDIVRAGLEYGIDGLCIWEWVMLGFYHRADPAGLHDYSPEELQELKDALTEITEMGVAVSTLTNMRLVIPTNDWWKNGGSAGAIRNTFGEARHEDWAVTSQEPNFWPRGRGPASSVLCAKSKVFRDLADEHLNALTEIGFNAMFLDQPFEYSPCYDPDHGHAEPGDTHEGIVDWVVDYYDRFTPLARGGYIMGEQPDLFTAQGIDVFWNWAWFKSRPDIISYAFPELTQTYVVDRSHKDALEGFLYGYQLALTTRGLTGELRQDPEWAEWLRELSALRTATADTTTLAKFVDDRGLRVEGPVQAKRFVTDGGTAVIVVNQSDETVTATIGVEGAFATSAVNSTPGCTWTDAAHAGGAGLQVTMAPWSALVWDLA